MSTFLDDFKPFTEVAALDPDALLANLRREGTPDRVFYMELFQDRGIEDAIDRRFDVSADLDPDAPEFEWQRTIAMQRFLGYETVPCSLFSLDTGQRHVAADTTEGEQSGKERAWLDEHKGVIASWEDFEKYPWPDSRNWDTSRLEWLEKNVPDDMCIVGRSGHICEYLCWLMGYESLCYALYDQRDLVEAVVQRILELEMSACRTLMGSDRVKMFFASDDLGFKTGLMISPDDMRTLVLSGHKRLAEITHEAGRPYLLHACGNRVDIIEDLIEDVKLDAIHSWEDAIEPVTEAKRNYGERLSLLGGIDVDVLCRASEEEIRRRVRETLDICQPGGGYCLGSGNSVANYIPMENYLAMLDEGRRY
ncbi:MAG: hypothetical protein HQ559_14535 [Lentisphaerae bacterium]|nr:hypothetical protein [Lentisphaerota bacterium]